MAGELLGLVLLLLVIAGFFRLSRNASRLRAAVYIASLPHAALIYAVVVSPPRQPPLGVLAVPAFLASVGLIWVGIRILRLGDGAMDSVVRSLNRGLSPLLILARGPGAALRFVRKVHQSD
jgi:hypothetical protein